MNLTINTHSSTWKNARNRYVIGVGGVALALSIAIGGISALPSLGSREASVTPQAQTQSRPSTLFGTDADAVLAINGELAVHQQFANPVDAIEASVALSFAQAESRAGTAEAFFGLGQPGEVATAATFLGLTAEAEMLSAGMTIVQGPVSVGPQFTSMTDAVEALYFLEVQQVSVAPTLAQPVSSKSVDSPEVYLGLGQPGERNDQLFANSVDAVEASVALSFAQQATVPVETREAYFGLGQAGHGPAPQFASMVDASDASIGHLPSPHFANLGETRVEYVQYATAEDELLSAGYTLWPATLAHRPVVEYVELVTPEAELLSTGINPRWEVAPSFRPVEYVQVISPEAEMLSAGMDPYWPTTLADRPVEYVQFVTPEAELLSAGINPNWDATLTYWPVEYVQFVTPEAELLSAGIDPYWSNSDSNTASR